MVKQICNNEAIKDTKEFSMTNEEIKKELEAIKASCDSADECAINIMRQLRESNKRLNAVLKMLKGIKK